MSVKYAEKRFGSYLAATIFLLLLWHLVSSCLSDPVLPGPGQAIRALIIDFDKGISRHVLFSAFRVTVSILLSTLLAVPLGLALGRETRIDRFLAPVIYLVYPIPKIIFLPIVFSFFGLGNWTKILLISLVVFFQVLVTTRDAARSVEKPLIYSVISLGASRKDIYWHVVLPACLPDIFTALRIGLGTAIAVLFITETFASREGIGFYLMDTWSRLAFDKMYAGVIAMALLGLSLYILLDWLERKICRWKYLE